MSRKPSGNPTGRPLKEIDWVLFEDLCALQCTQKEIAGCLKINVDTLCDRSKLHYGESYSEIYKKLSDTGKCSLRRNQFVLSKTNAAMAIWLGKQWLGQKDQQLEIQLPPEHQQKYDSLMKQLGLLQSQASIQLKNVLDEHQKEQLTNQIVEVDLKIEERSISSEQKSA